MTMTNRPDGAPKDLLRSEALLGFSVTPATGDTVSATKIGQVKSGTTKPPPAVRAD